MTDFADRAFQIFIDVDSSELPDAAYWLQARLIDREHPEHGQAVWVLRRLLEWVSADPRNEPDNRTTQMRWFDGNWHDDIAAVRDEAAYSRYGW